MEISIIEALGLSVLGISIVFLVLILLMGVIHCIALFTVKKSAPAAVSSPVATPAPAEPKLAPGSCGEVATFSVPDRVAAMVMAVTADQLNVPLNELRFISIKEAN